MLIRGWDKKEGGRLRANDLGRSGQGVRRVPSCLLPVSADTVLGLAPDQKWQSCLHSTKRDFECMSGVTQFKASLLLVACISLLSTCSSHATHRGRQSVSHQPAQRLNELLEISRHTLVACHAAKIACRSSLEVSKQFEFTNQTLASTPASRRFVQEPQGTAAPPTHHM